MSEQNELRFTTERLHHDKHVVTIDLSEHESIHPESGVTRSDGVVGRLVAAIQPDMTADHSHGMGTIYLVHYPDNTVRTAGVVPHGERFMLQSGVMLRPGERYFYGELGDREPPLNEEAVLGAAALTGVSGRTFESAGMSVSDIHGSLELSPDGKSVTIRDGGLTGGGDDGREELRSGTGAFIRVGHKKVVAPANADTETAPSPPRSADEPSGRDADNVIASHSTSKDIGEPAKPSPEKRYSPYALDRAKSELAACRELESILGRDGRGGGVLGDILRDTGNNRIEDVRYLLDPDRGDKALREKVLNVLRLRTEQLYQANAFKKSVRGDAKKPISTELADYYGGKTQMESLDWVASIALARLSGTFNEKLAPARVDSRELTNNGHHRDAAELVLESFRNEQSEQQNVRKEDGLDNLRSELTELHEQAKNKLRLINGPSQELLRYLTAGKRIDTGDVDYKLRGMQKSIDELAGLIRGRRERIRLTRQKLEDSGSLTNQQDMVLAEFSSNLVAATNNLETLYTAVNRYTRLNSDMDQGRDFPAILAELVGYMKKTEVSDACASIERVLGAHLS